MHSDTAYWRTNLSLKENLRFQGDIQNFERYTFNGLYTDSWVSGVPARHPSVKLTKQWHLGTVCDQSYIICII